MKLNFKKLVVILVSILCALMLYIFLSLDTTKATSSKDKNNMIQAITNDKVDKWKVIEEQFKDECRKQNLLIVLDGERSIRKVYSTTDDEVQCQDKSSFIKFLGNKLNEMKTRSITVDTTFKYSFTYDMSKIDVSVDNGVATIKLNRNYVSLRPIAELSDKRVISNEGGILSKNFTPQEVASIMHVTQTHTYNTIVNDNELYTKALQNTSENLKQLASNFGFKDIKVEIEETTETITNKSVDVVSDSN